MSNWFPKWQPYQGDVDHRPVSTNEYLPPVQSAILGIQHAFAMFGATVLAPLLMGFNPNLAILMSGICTILFFLITGGRVPSYLGSSFAFIGVVAAATGHITGSGANPNLSIALGGIVACGIFYALIGFIVMLTGTRWIEKLMPPVVTGAIVMIIGLNLAPVTIKGVAGQPFEMWMALITVLGLGKPIDFSQISQASWFGIPSFSHPTFDTKAILIIAPVALILVAENLGHIKAVGAMTGENLTPQLGKAFVADGLATTLSGSVGAPGMTTYGENIGVMAVTRVYSTIVFVIAGIFAIFLGLSPKFGAVISTIPSAVLTGASIVVFGLITIAGAKIWIENKVDFSNNKNLIVASVTIILGAGNFELLFGNFNLGGIGTATFAAIILNWLFSLKDKT
ncbi:pyrimidine utilization transport protein G [Acinetobacter baumannii]|nr:solute carrier family 23 protein [Acinetobacter baumannii]QCP20801.1 pyrimidine utilization transport protein G [Acinetobacter baumannii]